MTDACLPSVNSYDDWFNELKYLTLSHVNFLLQAANVSITVVTFKRAHGAFGASGSP